MDRKRLAVVFTFVAVAVAAIIVLLITGEAEPVRTFEDLGGDVALGEGDKPPPDTTLADIRSAEISSEDGDVVLAARLGGPIPKRLQGQAFDLRWEIYEDGDNTFLVTANLNVGPNGSIIGVRNAYGATSLEDRFPGSLEIEDDLFTIRLETDEIPDFPDEFGWVLTSSLDGDQGDPESARAEDRSPDQGFGEYPADS